MSTFSDLNERPGDVRACESPQVPGTKEAFLIFVISPSYYKQLHPLKLISFSSQLLSRKMCATEPNAVLI